ncbi:outer membrane beta-barrel family protein [Myroides sp. DF42-4-2]|uniref:outer membrane beta-barrel family protein n=2 Tax=unclassified Myroides TaxID=2642485 RepID=UPI002575949D|nr:outer membrane beta-barrel family protein [Myroides sp. DF42-4-2]MDM1407803.1 TonB-dependent receptor [Myroides sp. DF42-4-2]
MRNAILFFSLFLYSFCSYCQTYTGLVKNAQNEPLPFVNVVATDVIDNKTIAGVLTDETGYFSLIIPTSHAFILTLSLIGYRSREQYFPTTTTQDLGLLLLQEESSELQEVVIHAAQPLLTRKSDRLIFNVENSIVSAGANALEVLQKTAGVRIERDKIGMLGKNSVQILVNNRLCPLTAEDLTAYLRSIRAEDIARIEVMTNPPATYDAEGNSGLIHIVLKKTINNFWGGELTSSFQQSSYTSATVGGSLTYQKNKWSIFSSTNKNDGAIQVQEKNKIYYPTQLWDTDTKIKYFTRFFSNRTGIDYAVNDRSTIGIQYLGNSNRPDNQEQTSTPIYGPSKGIDSLLTTRAHTDKKIVSHALNGHFKTVFDTLGKNMTVDLDYFTYTNTQERINTSNVRIPQREEVDSFTNATNQSITTYTSTVNVEWPLGKVQFDFGGKVSFMQNNSDISTYNHRIEALDLGQSNRFNYSENTQALYASASKTLKKWDIKLGVRLEHTQTKGLSLTLNERQENRYTHLFPTLYVTYTTNENNQWSFNYGKRINRPSYSSLNPFRWYSTPYAYTEGNPFLQPFFSDNFEFAHVYKNNLNTSFYLSKTTNGVDQITLTAPNTVTQATIRKNFLKEISIGLSQSYTFKEWHWLTSYLQYNVNYTEIKSNLSSTKAEQSGLNFYFSLSNTLTFNQTKTLLGEVTFQYVAPGISGMDYITAYHRTDIGIRWLLLDRKLQLNAVGSDLFKTNKNTIKSEVNTIKQTYTNYYDTRQISLSLVYKFGTNIAATKTKNFSNEEERNRTD